MSKDDAINIQKNFNLNERKRIIIKFLLHIKMSETTYYQRNREKMLKRARDYYQNKNEASKDKARNKYGKLSLKNKNIKGKYGRNRQQNMSEKGIQKLK